MTAIPGCRQRGSQAACLRADHAYRRRNSARPAGEAGSHDAPARRPANPPEDRTFEDIPVDPSAGRSEEHTSELQSLMRISYAVFCLKKKNTHNHHTITRPSTHTHKQRTSNTNP